MDVKALWLFSERMNHSGDYGNILCLQSRLAECGLRLSLDRKTPENTGSFEDYDLIIACDAPLEEAADCMERLAQQGEALNKAVRKGTVMLFTGAARVLLGKTLTLAGGRMIHGCGVLAETHRETGPFRSSLIARRPGMGPTLYVGSYDRRVRTEAASEKPLFQMVKGVGDKPEALYEGARRENLYATFFLGPLLVRNPELLEELVQKLAKEKYLPPRNPEHPQKAKENALANAEKK